MRSLPHSAIMSQQNNDELLIVALGASAGGLEALEKFFSHMPADAGMAFIIVQHLAPDHASALAELLGKHTPMAVEEGRDNTQVVANRVYTIPPNATLTVKNSTLQVAVPAEPHGHRKAIDSLFSSVARDRGENAVCIMLSGTGTDGTLGLTAIKEHGGMAMAQSLETAQYDAILRSAIATGLVDHILPVEEMPGKLLEYADHLRALDTDGIRGQIGGRLGKLHEILLLNTGHDFSHYKESTVIRRMERRMNAAQIEGVGQYVEMLERKPEEVGLLLKDLLIGVTHFFRDPEAFQTLAREVIPKLFEGKSANGSVRASIVGCASGEEAYSIAMLLCEHAATLESTPSIQIFATDIDERGLEIARKGRYPQSIAEHVTPERLERFFTKGIGTYQVNRDLRELCIFSSHSFIKDPPFSRVDLISCRNVMIYLEAELQRKVLPLFHYALRPGGYLFLGPAESASSHPDLFGAVDQKQRIFLRKDTVTRPDIRLPLIDGDRPRQPAKTRADDQNLPKQLERIILRRHGPACVIVKESGEAVYFSGRINRYLEQPTGGPDSNVINMARDGVRLPLRTSLHKAVTTRARTTQSLVSGQTNGEGSTVELSVEPLTEFRDASLYLIVFEELPVANGRDQSAGPATFDAGAEELIRQLESELRAAQEYAQAAYEELETSNEELKSANEEYQSTNEELEASKEELQSFNEELGTVNTELNRKVAELKRAEDNLQRTNLDLQHFAFAASHDLQEPLRMVTSYTQLLARQYNGKLDRDADMFIGYAVQGAQRMEALLRDLREYWSVNEQRPSEPVVVDCEQVLAKALDVLAITLKEGGGIVTHDHLPTVMAEETPLALLFQNLIANALKYHRDGEPPRVHMQAEKNDGFWSFSVRDNAIGIAPEHLERIFAPFKRLHGAEYAGSGLGLAICRRIAARYGGRIWVESAYGHGSTFRFTIPAEEMG
jgi:two-component system CheB/CheR fusion protein